VARLPRRPGAPRARSVGRRHMARPGLPRSRPGARLRRAERPAHGAHVPGGRPRSRG
jgi:hypothetical protein